MSAGTGKQFKNGAGQLSPRTRKSEGAVDKHRPIVLMAQMDAAMSPPASKRIPKDRVGNQNFY